ncbi:MAG: DUF6311 domain-containing protein [Geminicoccaceae bacterium]
MQRAAIALRSGKPKAQADAGHDPALLAYAAAALLGLALVAYVFPLDYLLASVDLVRPPHDDMAQNVVMQRYFFADAWRWPLLDARNLVGPEGTNLGLLDGIPLIALPVKLLAPWLPPGFHAVNLWYGIVWLLQPLAAVWCLRGAGERRLLPCLAMAVAAVSMPVWWNRFGHASLCGQFVLLLAIGLYLRLVHEQSLRRWAGALLLELVALLIQPYLAMMVLAVLGAVPLTLLLRRDPGWLPAGAAVLALALLQLLGLVVLDYLGVTGGQGFGRFKMDALGPLWPHDSALFPWSLPEINAWEGYNYLGAGLLLGIVLACLLQPRPTLAMVRRHGGLALVLLGLGLFALSQRPTLGGQLLLDPGAVAAWLENFRSTGRFFWPVAYALLTAAILLAARLPNRHLATAVLIAIATLQFADAGVLRERVRSGARGPRSDWTVDAPALRGLLAQARSVTLLPTWYCTPQPYPEREQAVLLEVLLLASERAVPASTMDVPRFHGGVTCIDERIAAAPLGQGELRVLTPAAQARYLALIPGAEEFCAPAGAVIACHDPAATAPAPTEPPRPPPLRLGEDYRFSDLREPGIGLLGRGWSMPERDGVWSVGPLAELALTRPDGPAPGRLVVQLDLHAFPPASGSQDVVARLDGHEAGRWNLPGWRDTQLTIELPPGPPGTSTLQLEIAAPERPVDRGLGEDDRMLGVQLRALRVVPAPARPELTLDRLGFAPGSPSLEALAGGWSEPEAAGVWSQEDHATLVFLRPESLTGALELRLKLEAFAPKAQEKQKVELWSGDRQLATWKLDDRRSDWVEAILPAGPPGAVELELRIRAPTRPVDRRIGTDTRTLGVQLQGLQAKPASWWSRLL